jgi:DNA-binding MarR family transcriptional regulator
VNETCSFSADSSKSLLSTLLGAAQRVEDRVEAALGEAGLSLAKLGLLNHLVTVGEPLPLGQLAGRIACVKSNVTQLVDRLESDGLVSRVNDPNDRRCIRAAITDEGRNRYAIGADILRSQEALLVEEIGADRCNEIMSCLAVLGAELVRR